MDRQIFPVKCRNCPNEWMLVTKRTGLFQATCPKCHKNTRVEINPIIEARGGEISPTALQDDKVPQETKSTSISTGEKEDIVRLDI